MNILGAPKIIRFSAVTSMTGLSRSTIDLLSSRNQFPPQIRLGPRAVGWIEQEVLAWVKDRIDDSRR